MLKFKIIPSIVAVVCAAGFSACQKEEVLPNDALQQARQSAVAAGAQVLHADLPTLYRQASKLDDATWLELPVVTEGQTFPVQRIRRSPMLPRDAKFYITDGKTLTEQARPDLMVVEGLTADGRRGLFALSPEHFAGWYEAPEGRMYVQDLAFDHPEAETGELIVMSEAASLTFAPPSGAIGQGLDQVSDVSTDTLSVPMPDATCWKLELLMHGDWHYFSSVANFNVSSGNFGMLAFAVVSDPAFAAINMDLVVSNITLTQSATAFTANAANLSTVVRNFWANFPVNRDAVLYVSGADLYNGYLGAVYNSKQVCISTVNAVGVAEWQRNGSSGLSQGTCNGRIGGSLLGYLLGATTATSGLMYTANLFAPPATSNFSAASASLMNNHLWYHHSCLHQATCN